MAQRPRSNDPGIQRIRSAKRGTKAMIARRLKLRWQTIDKWKQVPLDHVFAVAKIARVPAEELRPDFFRNDPLRIREKSAQGLRPTTAASPRIASQQPAQRPQCRYTGT